MCIRVYMQTPVENWEETVEETEKRWSMFQNYSQLLTDRIKVEPSREVEHPFASCAGHLGRPEIHVLWFWLKQANKQKLLTFRNFGLA